MKIPLLAYVATFSEQLHFWRICFFTVSTSSEQLDLRVTISIQQLPFSNSCVFRAATFLEQQLFHIFHFFSAVNFFFFFSEQVRFQSETSTEYITIKNRQLFRTVTFSKGEVVQKKYFQRRATFLKQALLCSIKFFRTATFSTKLILQKTYLLRTTILSEKVLMENRYFFREAAFSNLLFQKTYFYTATVLIYKLIHFTLVSNVH